MNRIIFKSADGQTFVLESGLNKQATMALSGGLDEKKTHIDTQNSENLQKFTDDVMRYQQTNPGGKIVLDQVVMID